MTASGDFAEAAGRIRLLLLDCDGVLTDGRIGYGPDGDTWRFFNVRDGAAIKLAQCEGIAVGLLSGRNVEAVRRRTEELGFDVVRQGHRIKEPVWDEILVELGLDDEEVAFMGDDFLDLPLLRRAGLAACPSDGSPEARRAADVVTTLGGGRGCVRELIERILTARGRWNEAVASALAGE